VSKDNHQYPYDLVVSFCGFFGRAVDNGSNPKDGSANAHQKEYGKQQTWKDIHIKNLQ